MNAVKTLLVGVAAGLTFAGTALALTPYVHADTQDQEFANLLSEKDISINDLGITWAHEICDHLDNGSTLMREAQKVYTATDTTMDSYKSGFFVGAAVRVYCPWEGPSAS